MNQLFLHVGHPKTGSSYLQSILAIARQDLLKLGIDYPSHQTIKFAKELKITSGNGVILLAALQGERKVDDWFGEHKKICVSSEYMFPYLLPEENCDHFRTFIKSHKIDQVNILIFIRNPLDMAISLYHQFVKRGGGTDEFDKFIENFRTPFHVQRFLENFLDDEMINVSTYNYSYSSDKISDILFNYLGTENLSKISNNIKINRSLSAGELVLQKELNKVLGKSGELMADILCDQLPAIPSARLNISRESYERFMERLREPMEQVNRLVPQSEHYDLNLDFSALNIEEDNFSFSMEQLKVISEGVGGEIKRLRDENETLRDQLETLKNESQS